MKIAFCGTHSTGKSTLVEALRDCFPDYFFDVNVTRWLNDLGFKINEQADDNSQELNIIKRIAHLNSYKKIIADRSILDNYVYTLSAVRRGTVSNRSIFYQTELFISNIDKYDYLFYIPPEFDIEDDGVRSTDIDFRKEIDDLIKQNIEKFQLVTHTITGDVKQRVKQVLDTIGNHK